MRKYFLILSGLLFVSILSWGQTKPMVVNGDIKEINEGYIILEVPLAVGVDTIARAPIADGKFVLKAEIKEAYLALLKVEGYDGGFIFIAEPGEVYKAELFQSAPSTIRGGVQQEALIDYQNRIAEANVWLNDLNKQVEEATKEKKFRTLNELNKQLETRKEVLMAELDSLISLQRGTVFSTYIITGGLVKKDLNIMKAMSAQLNPQELQSHPGRILSGWIAQLERIDVGSIAPDFTLPDQDGKSVSLYSLPGKIKIIDFWASWCGPCRMENPNMVSLYADYKDKGLTIVGVSLDEKKDPWLKAIAADSLQWTQLSSLKGWKCEAAKLYNIDGVPTILIIDENNRILAMNLRGERLREFVAERIK